MILDAKISAEALQRLVSILRLPPEAADAATSVADELEGRRPR